MSKYSDAYAAIQAMAEVKMSMNNHKGDITNIKPERAITLAIAEMEELKATIEDGNHAIDVIGEAADVLNFMMAIVYDSIERYRRKNGDDRTQEAGIARHSEIVRREEMDNSKNGTNTECGGTYIQCNNDSQKDSK